MRNWTSAVALLVLAVQTRALGQDALEEQHRRQALVHYRAGEAALHGERFEEALTEFTAATRLDPLLTLAHYGRGQAYMAMKRYPEAVSAFQACRKAFLDIANLGLRNAAQADKQRTEQIEALRESIAVLERGGRGSSRNERSIRLLEERLRDLERSRRGGDEDFQVPAEVSFSLGSAYFRDGALADAEREYLAALRLKPRLGEAHNNLAVVYMLTGRLPEAEAEIVKADKAGFQVSSGLRADLEKRKRAASSRPPP